jgi:hypothetical protein
MARLSGILLCALAVTVALTGCKKDTTAAPVTTTTGGPIAGTRFEVTGTLKTLSADAAVGDALAPPFTINVAERGVGGAEIDGASVNARTVQINWNGGRPLPVEGPGPGLNLNAAPVAVDGSGIVWSLDGAARDFLPGIYTLGSSVAVGNGGLGAPVDKQTFTAAAHTTLSSTGHATVALPAGALRIEGDQGTLTMLGALKLGTTTGDRIVKKVVLTAGTYEVTLTPVAGGYTLLARLEGRIVA